MAKKKSGAQKVPAIEEPLTKSTSQARIELPTPEFDRVRDAARRLGLSVSGFIRMAVLKETRRVEKEDEA